MTASEIIPGRVIDFGVLTILEDEFEAVLNRFPRCLGRHRGTCCSYEIREFIHEKSSYTICITRMNGQGNIRSGVYVNHMITDCDPRWVVIVGIAGGYLDKKCNLGDVVFADSIIDLSLEASLANGLRQYTVSGSSPHPSVLSVLATLPADRNIIEAPMRELSGRMPHVSIDDSNFEAEDSGSREWMLKTMVDRFGNPESTRSPHVLTGPIISGDRLVRDPELAESWRSFVRHAKAVEMEAAGAQLACSLRGVPLLAIRGISDIFGFKRDREWNTFASESAAAAFFGFLHTLPLSPAPEIRISREDPVPPGDSSSSDAPPLRTETHTKITKEHTDGAGEVNLEISQEEGVEIEESLLVIRDSDSGIDPVLLEAFKRGDYQAVISRGERKLADDTLTTSEFVKISVLVAESLHSENEAERSSSQFYQISKRLPPTDPRHWIAKLWGKVVAKDVKSETLEDLREARSKFPLNEELATVGVWTESHLHKTLSNYYHSLSPEIKTTRVQEAVARVAQTKSDWPLVIEICADILTLSPDNMYAQLGKAKALIEDDETFKYAGGPSSQSIKEKVAEAQSLLESIWHSRKRHIHIKERSDMCLEAGLYLIDCLTFGEQSEQSEKVSEELLIDYPEHWGAKRAYYLMWQTLGLPERAATRMKHILDTQERGDGYAQVVVDYARNVLDRQGGNVDALQQVLTYIDGAWEAISDGHPMNMTGTNEALLETQVAVLRSMGAPEKEIREAVGSRCAQVRINSALCLMLVLDSYFLEGSIDKGQQVYRDESGNVLSELGKSELFRLALAKACARLELHEDALGLLRPIPYEDMSGQGIATLTQLLCQCGNVAESVSLSISYQQMSGYNLELTRGIVATLSQHDPLMLVSFLSDLPEEIGLDWQIFHELVRLRAVFGIRQDVPARTALETVASQVPPENIAAMMKTVGNGIGLSAALFIGVEALIRNHDILQARADYFWGVSKLLNEGQLPPLDEGDRPSQDYVYVLKDGLQEGSDKFLCVMSERPGLGSFFAYAADGGPHRDAIVRFETSRDSSDDMPTVVGLAAVIVEDRIPLWMGLVRKIQEEIQSDARYAIHGVGIEKGPEKIGRIIAEEKVKANKSEASIIEVFQKVSGSAHLAKKMLGRPVEDIMMSVWGDRDCTQWATSGHLPADLNTETPILLDYTAFVTCMFASGFELTVMRELPAPIIARPEFFFQAYEMWKGARKYLGHTKKNFAPDELLGKGGLACISSMEDVRMSDAALRYAETFGMEMVAPVSPIGGAARPYVIWTDDGMQRKLGDEFGVKCVATTDVVDWLAVTGKISREYALRVRSRLFRFGHDGASFTLSEIAEIAKICLDRDGEDIAENVIAGLKKSFRNYRETVSICAHMLNGLAIANADAVTSSHYVVRMARSLTELRVALVSHNFSEDVLKALVSLNPPGWVLRYVHAEFK